MVIYTAQAIRNNSVQCSWSSMLSRQKTSIPWYLRCYSSAQLDSQHKQNYLMALPSGVQWWKKMNETSKGYNDRVSALCFLQCFDAVGLSSSHTNPMPLITKDSLLEQMEERRKPLENGHTKNGAATLLLAAYWAWTECSSPSRANEPIQYEVYYKFLTNVCESVELMWPQISTQYFDCVRWTAGTAHGLLKPFCHNSSAVTLIFKKLQKHVHACTWCIVQKNQYHRRNQPWQYTYIITHTHTHTLGSEVLAADAAAAACWKSTNMLGMLLPKYTLLLAANASYFFNSIYSGVSISCKNTHTYTLDSKYVSDVHFAIIPYSLNQHADTWMRQMSIQCMFILQLATFVLRVVSRWTWAIWSPSVFFLHCSTRQHVALAQILMALMSLSSSNQ